MLTVVLYRRRECASCDEVREMLASLQEEIPHRLVEVDIASSSSLRESYGENIPVLEAGPYRLNFPFSLADIRMTLRAAADRQSHLLRVDENEYRQRVQRARSFSSSERFSYWLSRHYLALVNLALFLYVGLAFLAPVLMKAKKTIPAKVIYTAYSPLCHQLGFRSWFLFGEQIAYPRAAAHVEGWKTFGEATGLDEEDFLAARAFRGNETTGYKVAICERDVAIYGGMFLFGLLFAAAKRRIRSLHALWWLLIGWIPIGLDGGTQIISQMRLSFLTTILPYRESTPFLRTLTGFLFGFTTAWFGLPYIEEAMRDAKEFFEKKSVLSKVLD